MRQDSLVQRLRRELRKRSFIIIALIFTSFGIIGVIFSNLWPYPGLITNLTNDIGIALFTSGIIGFALEYKTREEYLEETSGALQQALDASEVNAHVKSISNKIDGLSDLINLGNSFEALGVRKIYLDRSSINLNQYIQEAPDGSEIRLLGVSMKTFTGADSEMIIKKKLMDGCKIKILMLDPDSSAVLQRAEEEREDYEWLKSEISSSNTIFRNMTRKIPENLQKNIQIKVYKSSASQFILATSKKMVVSPYLSGRRGYFCPHLELDIRDGGLCSAFIEHFEFIWEKH